MLQSAFEAFKNCIDTIAGAEKTYKDTLPGYKQDYSQTKYLELAKQAREAFEEVAAAEISKAEQVITANFDSVRAELAEAVTAQPNADILDMLLTLDAEAKYSDSVKQLIYDKCAGNYLALNKLFTVVKYDEETKAKAPNYDDVLEALQLVEQMSLKSLHQPSYIDLGYNARLVYDGSMYEGADEAAQAFVSQFGRAAA